MPTDAQSASQWISRALSLDEDSGMDPVAVNDLPMLLAQREGRNAKLGADEIPEMARAFAAFVTAKAIATRWDEDYFYVESNGIPDHRMMVGIKAWQQQVPLPQKYTGENAWRIPLRPVPAKKPQSTKGNFLRGAIALAANGIPIFNPLNNRGDDAFLFGELDEFGGHCGRADDYHYHLAPVHLQKVVGQGNPIAYALDGYPIYGYEEPDGSKVVGLDSLNGHKDADGNYHYHATKKYPYLNGGFFGEVIEREGQVDPQPRAEPLRPALQPLRDATITEFVETKPGSYRLTYEVGKRQGTVSYTLADDGSAKFEFVDPSGKKSSETYTPRRRGPGGNDRRPPPPPPRKGEKRGARDDRRPAPPEEDRAASVDSRGFLSVDCTCDGAGRSPAIEWSDAPAETKCFAISLWHTAPDQEKSYWLVYNIPADVSKLDTNSKSVGKLGLNDRRRTEYDPMCSKGPGVKTYHITVFALSAEPDFGREKPNRASLLKAIQKLTVAEETLDFQYERLGSK
ncbi:MAG: YHYH protein [Planctomycetota bacterium]|nr:YHYH protein [Planctomycetota bacterium]